MHISFGTDGVRGVANEQVTVELAVALGRAAVRAFSPERVYVGRDTRLSSPMLAAAVLAGVCAEGAEAVPMGVVPSPAVAFASNAANAANGPSVHGRSAGVMISASHNPYRDNGLKIFAPGGRKLTDEEQHLVESHLDELLDGTPQPGPRDTLVGRVGEHPEVIGAYAGSIVTAIEGRTLDGIKVVLDCANGSNSVIGPEVLGRLGAEVVVIADRPDGLNINDECGSTYPEALSAAVLRKGADVGVAFDGDADRLVAVDGTGRVVHGDQLIAMCAIDMRARGLLRNDTVVVTVMSNLGFRHAMEQAGITLSVTAVGDRYVLEELERGDHSLGGEQSGHLIFRDLSTTGDGLLSAVILLDLIRRSGRRLADLADASMSPLPQVLVNVAVSRPVPEVAELLADELDAVAAELGDTGRVLLRPSGTEPVVRVMTEAPTEAEARAVAERLARAVEGLSHGDAEQPVAG